MTFLAPLAFALGMLGAAVVVGLHLLTTRRPPSALLPTARFVPVAEARAVARARRPTDLVLLVLRVLALLLVGAAFARPVLDAPGPRVRSVVLLDLSAAVASLEEAAARARTALGEGSALVVFDTAARVVPLDSLDALAAMAAVDPSRPARGSLSAAFAAAKRVAGDVARGADSVRLVVVSPFMDIGLDAATEAWRAAWPGRAEFVRVASVNAAGAAAADAPRSRVAPVLVAAAADDPLLPALALLGPRAPSHEVRILRRAASATDTAWASGSGRLLVTWPNAESTPRPDAVHVSGPGGVTLVAPLSRIPLAELPVAGSDARAADRTGPRVLARWRDGEPAVTESPRGSGCVRSVGVGVPTAGDLTLRAPFARFLGAVTAPCGGERGTPLSDSVVTALAGSGPLAAARLLAADDHADARIPALLLTLALLGLAAEWMLRRRNAA